MELNTRPLQPAQAAPDLSPLGRYCVSVLASTAHRSGVDEDGIRRLFARCDQVGLGLGPGFEASVLSEFAAMEARAS